MTTTTLAPTGGPAPVPTVAPVRAARVTFPRVVTSEAVKFRSVRSTAWALPITALVMVAFALLQAWGAVQMELTAAEIDGGAAALAVSGVFFGQIVVAVLAVLAIGGEYSTGQIRSTLTAVPTRVPALLAKALVLFVAVAVTAVVATGAALAVCSPFLAELGIPVTWDAGSLRVLAGGALYLATIAVLALAIGAMLRHTAGALATVLALLLVVENVIGALPFRFFEVVSPYLPQTAGMRLLLEDHYLADGLGPWQGYGVLAAWTVLGLAVAAVLLRRRDA